MDYIYIYISLRKLPCRFSSLYNTWKEKKKRVYFIYQSVHLRKIYTLVGLILHCLLKEKPLSYLACLDCLATEECRSNAGFSCKGGWRVKLAGRQIKFLKMYRVLKSRFPLQIMFGVIYSMTIKDFGYMSSVTDVGEAKWINIFLVCVGWGCLNSH